MRKILIIAVIFIFTISCQKKNDILDTYLQVNVLPDNILNEYSKYGAKVNNEIYYTNNEFYSNVRFMSGGEYDLTLPSTFMVTQLNKKNIILEIDINKLKNVDNVISSFFVQPYKTAKQYSVPYLTDSIGIIINTKYINETAITKWDDFWANSNINNILIKADMRDFFSIALKSLGYTANTMMEEEIREAYDRLTVLLPRLNIVTYDEIEEALVSEEKIIGIVYYSEAYRLIKQNKNLKFINPLDGSLMWIRSFTIPKASDNVNEAYKFIDYMIQPETAAQVSMAYGLVPLLNYNIIKPYLPQELQLHYEVFMSDENLKKLEIQQDVGSAVNLYLTYWNKLINNQTN